MKNNMKMRIKEKLDSFVPFPRKIRSDLLNGHITYNEFFVYVYMRLSVNPYGVATVSLADIRTDVFRNKIGINYCNKILLSLKRKRYVGYRRRSGVRGSFEVHFDEIKLPSGKVKTLDVFFDEVQVRDSDTESASDKSESSHSKHVDSQRLNDKYTKLKSGLMDKMDEPSVRGTYNDNDNDK